MSAADSVTRISERFRALKLERRCALIAFVTAGFPEADSTVSLMRAAVAGGVDIIEIGVPFSDPMADGPVIQRASDRALKNGVTLDTILEQVRQFRETDQVTPVILMGYANPLERYGYGRFATEAPRAGIDGVLIVDLPVEALVNQSGGLEGSGLNIIFLLAPTTSSERMKTIADHASGFLYCVSVKGVTGTLAPVRDEVAQRIAELKQFTELPIGVGFGIRTAEQAADMAGVADAVVVGTALIEVLEAASNAEPAEALRSAVSDFRRSVDCARGVAA